MNKQEFLDQLRLELSGLPKEDLEERLNFYAEIIDDRIEDGLSEEEAVNEIGPSEEIASQIIAETPLSIIVKERVKPKRRLKAWEIVLLILGAPLWIPLLIAAFAVLFSLYIVLWSLMIALWAVDVAFIASALAGIAGGCIMLIKGESLSALMGFGIGMIMAGLSIFLFFGCKAATKGTVVLTKKMGLGIKTLFLAKETEK